MLKSWHNFFFVSFDPGGLVSVDKPPLALWLEAASAKLFGFSGTTLLLPGALAGVAAVWVLYLLVARYFGKVAGLVAALALAVSPVSVAVNRDNNPDAVFTFLLVLAAYAGARAVESGRLRWLLTTAVVVGLAFNTKMLASLVVVPGLAAGYLFFAKLPWRTRLIRLLAAGAVLVVVSGAWIAAVDLTPANDRPYVGSTTNNSELSLAFDYNGLGRVDGQTGGTSFGGGLGGAFSGTPGWLRLINDALGDQGGWLLPLAIVGGLSALLVAARARRRLDLGVLTVVGGWFVAAAAVFSFSSGIIHTYYLSALAPATCALVGIGVLALWRDARAGGARIALPLVALGLTAWLEVDLLRRSDYLSWLQVLVIAGAAIAAVALVPLAVRRGGPASVRRLLPAAAIGLGVAVFLAAPAAWSATTWKAPVNGVFPGAGPSFISGLGSTAQSGPGGFGAGRGGFGQGRGGFRRFGFGPPNGRFAPPNGGFFGGRGGFPGFRRPGGRFTPPTGRGGFFSGSGPGPGDSSSVDTALRYAQSHAPGTRWSLIVSSEQEAAPYVIQGKSVAAMGGFTGRETVLTRPYLARLVRSGEARHFLLGGGGGFFRGNNAAVQTITSTCREVPASAWAGSGSSSTGGFGGGSALYDCAGRADAIAHAAG
jgi:4-amino-4-deoxy-L-arabinose transferase-like glycosyltransferase